MEHYLDIIQKLKEEFPIGTVQFTGSKRPYIPNQVYTDRLESATESKWNKVIKELDINVTHRYVKAIVTITIGEHSRDGYGVAIIKGDPEQDPSGVINAVDLAMNSAFIEALDSFQMGWRDLAPHKTSEKEWGSNPALSHLLSTEPPNGSTPTNPRALTSHICLVCSKPLIQADWELLNHVPNLRRDKMIYCFNDIPAHHKRKIPEFEISNYLLRIK
ncbi:hypothetical protein JI735_34380 (plasmid) [Paenibacillus sonchi]|uniref:Uncharacterized protein n=1 Tax=Paenibacillus sonchi TaxID=373687 RepID=A0A974SGM2_9BACL|nr:hypothetical protein [Paenibacillus sonchi]QQZ64526.1 hypothetical protein JI735_34380 [Paenibacillus sonchi]